MTPVGDSTATSAHDRKESKMPPDVLIALDGIDKSFSSTQVLKNVKADQFLKVDEPVTDKPVIANGGSAH